MLPDAEFTQGDLNFHRTLVGVSGRRIEPDKMSSPVGLASS